MSLADRLFPQLTMQKLFYNHFTFSLTRWQNMKILAFWMKIYCLFQSEVGWLLTRMFIRVKVCMNETNFRALGVALSSVMKKRTDLHGKLFFKLLWLESWLGSSQKLYSLLQCTRHHSSFYSEKLSYYLCVYFSVTNIGYLRLDVCMNYRHTYGDTRAVVGRRPTSNWT